MKANRSTKVFAGVWLSLSLLFSGGLATAEQDPNAAVMANQQQVQQQQQVAPGQVQAQGQTVVRSLAVLSSIDQTGIFGSMLQTGLGTLFQQMSDSFSVQLSAYNLPAFTPDEIMKAHQLLSAEVITLVYLEHEAAEPTATLSIYLFDINRPNDFILVTRQLTGQAGGDPLNPQYVEYEFRNAFTDLVTAYSQGVFQPLPGTEADQAVADQEDDIQRRSEDAKRLFREISSLEEKKYYLGANVGMARFSGDTGADSNVNFGLFGGMKTGERTRLELGADIFSYALVHLDGRYVLPLNEKFVTLTVSLGLGRIMGGGLGNSEFNTTTLDAGQIVVGPGMSFDIPLLGTSLRGEIKFYIGAGSILFGTYGVSYSI